MNSMPEANISELETLFLALNDKTRLRLLAIMADGPVSVGYLADSLRESQPKVSRHLAYMRNAGIVSTRRDGKWIYYGIEYPMDASLRAIMEMVVRSVAEGAHPMSGEQVHASARSARTKRKPLRDNIYGQADVNSDIYVGADVLNEMSEEVAEIVGPIDEEMFYGSETDVEPGKT